MFGKDSIRLFRFCGIDVFLHWSWFIVAAYEIASRQGTYSSPVWNIVEYLALFLIVLLHEFGHSFACKQVGGQALRITLWPLGGVASVNPPQRPGAMLWSIAAGPLVNVGLIGVLWGATAAGSTLHIWDANPNLRGLVHSLSIINAGLLIFNLLPIYPLDGGQILRSLLWFVIGRGKSLMAAAIVGFGGVGLAAIAVVKLGSGWLAVLGIFAGLSCWNGLLASRTLMRLERAPRHDDYRCPNCQAHPQRGNFWRCHKCSATFDTFDASAVCPACGTEFERTACFECSAANPFATWKDLYPMNPTTSIESELPGVKPLAEPLYNVKNWMRLVGILTILGGILIAFTIIGIVVAWIPVLAGISLFQAASKIEEAVISNKSDYLTGALSKIGYYFKMTAVIRLISFGVLCPLIFLALAGLVLLNSSRPKNEAIAIDNIRKVNAAESKYLSSTQRYGSLQELAGAGLVESRLLDQVNAYRIQVETQRDNYIVLASAMNIGGRYEYYSFADAIIRYSSDSRKAPAGLASSPVG